MLKVPVSALFRGKDGAWAVFVLEGDSRWSALSSWVVATTWTPSSSRLAPGDQVIVHPSDSLVDGALVRPR